MISIIPAISRTERIVIQSGMRALSTKVPRTPEQVKEGIERVERMKKFMQKSGKLDGVYIIRFFVFIVNIFFIFYILKLNYFLSFSANTDMARGVGSGWDLHVPKNISEMAALSGMPKEHSSRTILIGQRQLKSVQSGQAYAHQWQITWKNEERWKNPLMGWGSSADPMAQVKVSHFVIQLVISALLL